jgi:hypothetical protein
MSSEHVEHPALVIWREANRIIDHYERHARDWDADRNGESVGTYRGDPLYHASLNPDEYAALLGTIGFEVCHSCCRGLADGGRSHRLAFASWQGSCTRKLTLAISFWTRKVSSIG